MDELPREDLWIPPHNLDMERRTIASCLISPDSAIPIARDVLTTESFYRLSHRTIWDAICHLSDRGQGVDICTVAERLERDGGLEEAGGLEFLQELYDSIPTAANVATYAAKVQELYVRRQAIAACQQLLQGMYDLSGEDVMAILQDATGKLLQLNIDSADNGKPVPLKQLVEELSLALDKGPTRIGMEYHRTGFTAVDAVIGGLADGELQYWGAGPGNGKTTALLQVALHLARQGKPVLLLSMELGRKRVAERIGSIVSSVPGSAIQYDAPKGAYERYIGDFRGGLTRVSELPLYISFGRRSTAWARRQAQDIMSRHGQKLALLGTDRLEKWADSDVEKFDNRQRISRLSNRTSAIAADLDIPHVCLCQLSRAGQKAPEPGPGDFRDCGDIEQDCQVGLIIRSDKDRERTSWFVVKANDCAQGLCEAHDGADHTMIWRPTIPMFINIETRFGGAD